MFSHETLAVVVSIISLVIALLAFLGARKSNSETRVLTESELRWVRMQIDEAVRTDQSEKQAKVSARIHKEGKNFKVRVFNRGPADAKEVNVIICSENSFLSSSDISEKFPIKNMEVHQSVDLFAHVHLQSESKEEILLRWVDETGAKRENSVELTL